MPEDPPPSGNPEKERIATVTNSEVASEGKENTPVATADIAVPTIVATDVDVAAAKAQALAPTSRVLRTGAIARLSESAKRFISSFRGRTVHGVEVALPKGYVGLVLRGDANGKTHQPTSNAKRRRARAGQRHKKPKIAGGEDGDDDERHLDNAAEMSSEDGRPVSVLKPAARFDSFVLWHPDIAVDEGKDEYLRSLSEWVNIAAEVRPQRSESVRVGRLWPDIMSTK
jgi:ribonuclease H2 subunit C